MGNRSSRTFPLRAVLLVSLACLPGTAAPASSEAAAPGAASPAAGAAAAAPANTQPPVPSSGTTGAGVTGAEAAFESLKTLVGRWKGRSTKGWQAELDVRLIANGTVLVETSEFDAHPGETMLTTIARDGGRLLLTHYCVAGNQPRMAATGVQDGGRTILFDYVDGGNLASRDEGHMDRALFRLIDADHFSSQWTWYEKEKERWMEEVQYERIP